MQKLLTFFSKNISLSVVLFNDQSFNDTLTNVIFSFEQLGPGVRILRKNMLIRNYHKPGKFSSLSGAMKH